jgi:hypothetical protein
MQKIELHPTSLLAGAALAVLAFVAMAPTPPLASTAPTPPGLIPARSMIQIKQSTPYVVPAGQLLVITGVGSTAGNYLPASLSVNGVVEIVTYPAVQGGLAANNGDSVLECRSMVPVPPGLAIQQGSVVTVTGAAWGYVERY